MNVANPAATRSAASLSSPPPLAKRFHRQALTRAFLALSLIALHAALPAAAAPAPAPAPAPAKAAAGSPLRADTMLPSAGLREDAALLRDAFEELHPGFLRYNSAAKLDAAFSALDAEFGRDRTLADAYRLISLYTAKIRCGHTWPSFFNQSKPVEKALFQSPRLPFTFRWVDEKMIVTHAFEDESLLPPGTEIAALDGASTRKVLWTLMPVARADGSNDAKRVSTLEVTGRSRYEAFDVYYPLFFPMRTDSIIATIRRPGAKTRERVALALQPFDVRDEMTGADRHDAPGGATPIWTHEWLDERTAILRMPTWTTYQSKWDWKADLDRSFAEFTARRDVTLIVDLRGNEGGTEDVGRELLSRIISEPFHLETLERKLHYRKVSDDLLPHLETLDPAFKDWGNAVMEVGDGYYRKIQSTAADNVVEPVARPFTGPVFVLVGAANSSATFQFAEVVQRSGRAKLVGQPTGGNQNGINGGGFFFLRLPNSGIEVDLPLIGYFAVFPQPDRGLDPDIPVKPSVDAIVRGADAELEALQYEMSHGKRARR